MKNLPEIFCIAFMVPARRYCHAHALWINQKEKVMMLTESEAGFKDEGGLKFELEPYDMAKFLQNRVMPINRHSTDIEVERDRWRARSVITDGVVRNAQWHMEKDAYGRWHHEIEEKENSIIPVRFKPVQMGFMSGFVEGDHWDCDWDQSWEGNKSWQTATSWVTSRDEPDVMLYPKHNTLYSTSKWEMYLKAAAHCWEIMCPSQVKVVMDCPEDKKPFNLREMWQHFRDCTKTRWGYCNQYQWGNAVPVIDQILEHLTHQKDIGDQMQHFDVIEKAINRAARKGRVPRNRVRDLLALLAAGNALSAH